MTYVCYAPSKKPLETLIPLSRLRFTEQCSDLSKRYFRVFCQFKKVKLFILLFFHVGPFR